MALISGRKQVDLSIQDGCFGCGTFRMGCGCRLERRKSRDDGKCRAAPSRLAAGRDPDRTRAVHLYCSGAGCRGADVLSAGIALAPDGAIGTSNAVSAPTVRLRVDAARPLVFLPRWRLDAVRDALLPPGADGGKR